MTTIEVIGIDHSEGLPYDRLCHHHSVVGTPRLLTPLWYREALRELVEILEYNLYRDLMLVLGDNLFPELLLEGVTNDEDDLAEACTYSIVDRVVHDRLS